MLDDAVGLPSSRGLQCGTWGCAATGKAGRRRDPLEKSVTTLSVLQKLFHLFILSLLMDLCIHNVQKHYSLVCNVSSHSPVILSLNIDWLKMHFVAVCENTFIVYFIIYLYLFILS